MGTLVGKTISGFRITSALGAGALGETFVAEVGDGGRCAVKLLHGKLSLMDRVAPFWEAQQRLIQLSHPYVLVPSASKWTSAGRFLMRMPLLEGVDLEGALARTKRLPARQVLRFFGQVCLALEAAHEGGVVHGALAPRNIFIIPGVDGRGSARVMDFAGHLLAPASQIAGDADHAPYAAPELVDAPPTPAADVHAIGALLFHAISGTRRPAAELELLEAPAGLREVIGRACAKDPAQRYPTVQALREALEAWAGTDPPELVEDPAVLFPEAAGPEDDEVTKKQPMDGVAPEWSEPDAEMVQVPFDDLSRLFVDEEPLKVSTNEEKRAAPASADTTQHTREELELAAMAEHASAPLRGKPRPAADDTLVSKRPPTGEKPAAPAAAKATPTAPAAAQAAPPASAEAGARSALTEAKDDAEDAVELPLERTVRAFVNTLAPIVPPSSNGSGSNGESLDGAFDAFVRDAKALSTALPRPIVDDRQLADLAKVPVPEPKPEPKPAPKPEPVIAPPPGIPLMAPAAPPRSIAPALIGGLVVGGLLVFGGMKLLGGKGEEVTPQPADPGAAVTAPAADLTVHISATAEADAEATATAEADAAATATEDGEATASTAADGAAAAAPEPDAAAAAAAPPDASAVATPTRPRKPRRVRPAQRPPRPTARKPRKPRKATKPTKPTKTGPAKGGSDWVDPFSQ